MILGPVRILAGLGAPYFGWRLLHRGPIAWFLLGFGIALIGFGIHDVIRGIRRMRRKAAFKRAIRLHPGERWRADYDWDPRGTHDRSDSILGWKIQYSITALLILVPAFVLMATDGLKPADTRAERADAGKDLFWAAFLGIVLIALAVVVVYAFLRRAKYGRAFLHFSDFPCFLGGPMKVTFASAARVEGIETLTATLRCVQERYEYPRHRESDDSRQVNCYEVYRLRRTFVRPTESMEGGRELEMDFQLPDRTRYASNLAARPARYWELEVVARTKGIDLKKNFLLPVYARRKK